VENQDSANSEGMFRLRYAALNMTTIFGDVSTPLRCAQHDDHLWGCFDSATLRST